jgi:hypothetical protein
VLHTRFLLAVSAYNTPWSYLGHLTLFCDDRDVVEGTWRINNFKNALFWTFPRDRWLKLALLRRITLPMNFKKELYSQTTSETHSECADMKISHVEGLSGFWHILPMVIRVLPEIA